ncbi:hypothetical protein [Mesobacillus zeae]|uniref:hypothetical protein n=1 Tax=Mesobacillus zeae TaxID=1917180 RepID=UPI0030098A61
MGTFLASSAYVAFVITVASLVGVALASGISGDEADKERRIYLRISGTSITYVIIAIAVFYVTL